MKILVLMLLLAGWGQAATLSQDADLRATVSPETDLFALVDLQAFEQASMRPLLKQLIERQASQELNFADEKSRRAMRRLSDELGLYSDRVSRMALAVDLEDASGAQNAVLAARLKRPCTPAEVESAWQAVNEGRAVGTIRKERLPDGELYVISVAAPSDVQPVVFALALRGDMLYLGGLQNVKDSLLRVGSNQLVTLPPKSRELLQRLGSDCQLQVVVQPPQAVKDAMSTRGKEAAKQGNFMMAMNLQSLAALKAVGLGFKASTSIEVNLGLCMNTVANAAQLKTLVDGFGLALLKAALQASVQAPLPFLETVVSSTEGNTLLLSMVMSEQDLASLQSLQRKSTKENVQSKL
jgi:hypothetical protein